MKLSLIVHANRNRGDRVQCLLTRLTLNKSLHPDIPFEVIVFDGGSTDNTRDICDFMSKVLDLKYIFVPIDSPTDETYALSVATRLTTGDIIGFVSADHWISENLIKQMTEPFDDHGFRIGKLACSEKSSVFATPVSMIDQLLDDRCSNKQMEHIIEIAKIPTYCCAVPEVWSALKENVPTEWDYKWHEKIPLSIQRAGDVMAIDMWSPPQDFEDVPESQLGTLPEYGYAIINGEVLDREELEEYIEQQST